MTPNTPAELACMLRRIAERGDFKYQSSDGSVLEIPRRIVLGAIEEIVKLSEDAYVGEATPTACQSLVGLLFVSAVEAEPEAVTIGVTDPQES